MSSRNLPRLCWVLGVNSVFLAFFGYALAVGVIGDLRDPLRTSAIKPPDWQNAVSVLLLAAGMVAEGLGSWVARYLNIGYFALLGMFAGMTLLAEALGLVHARGMSIVFFLFLGAPALLIALVNFRLYSSREPARGGPVV